MNKILMEMTMYQLNRSVQNQFGDKREQKSSRMTMSNIKYTPVQTGKVTGINVTADCLSGDSGQRYQTIIVFKKVVLDDEDTPENMTTTGSDGQPIHINQKSLANSDVQVRCSCLDFYWRWANTDFNQRALYGDKPPPYVNKTNRPPVNPQGKAGICKHIYKLLQMTIPGQYRN